MRYIFWPFVKLDRALLLAIERLSHGLQRTFGITSGKSAQACYGAFIGLSIKSQILDHLLSGHSAHWWYWFWSISIVLFYLPMYFLLGFVANLKAQLRQLGVANSSKIRTTAIFNRLLTIFMLVILTLDGSAWAQAFVFLGLSEYFDACDDLPPGMSRVRKLINAIRAGRLVPATASGERN